MILFLKDVRMISQRKKDMEHGEILTIKKVKRIFFSFMFKTHFLVCISTMDNFHFKQLVSKVNDSIDEFSLIIYIVYAINITINIGNVCINRYILLSIIIVISFVSKVRYAFRNIILII